MLCVAPDVILTAGPLDALEVVGSSAGVELDMQSASSGLHPDTQRRTISSAVWGDFK
jgi:hypothetical protein